MDGDRQADKLFYNIDICDVACQNQALFARRRSMLDVESAYPQDVESGLLAKLVS